MSRQKVKVSKIGEVGYFLFGVYPRELSNMAKYLKDFSLLLQMAVGYLRGGTGCGEVR